MSNNYLESIFKVVLLTTIIFISTSFTSGKNTTNGIQESRFDIEKDLLLVQFDCKTDVDDLHTMAALATLLEHDNYSKLKYHAVTGSYGIQEGLYVPPNTLMELAFKDHWTDAHSDITNAIKKVKTIILSTLEDQGDIWIAEAGQSDFTAEIIKSIKFDSPGIKISERIHVIQHSDWNEKSMSRINLEYVKNHSDYEKIPDGNITDNGTPGFQDESFNKWQGKVSNSKKIELWELAIKLSNEYNGKDGRYNNKAIAKGGLDFSDLSEVCWILELTHIKNVEHFFNLFGK